MQWMQHCRIKHMTTRRYLKVDDKLQLTLTNDLLDPSTIFSLRPIMKVKHVGMTLKAMYMSTCGVKMWNNLPVCLIKRQPLCIFKNYKSCVLERYKTVSQS